MKYNVQSFIIISQVFKIAAIIVNATLPTSWQLIDTILEEGSSLGCSTTSEVSPEPPQTMHSSDLSKLLSLVKIVV